MEGLIPFLLQVVKKQRPQNAYRCISENSVTGRSFHLLLAGDSREGSSHRRTRSHYQPLTIVDFSEHLTSVKSFSSRSSVAYSLNADSELRQRTLTSAAGYQVCGGTYGH